MKWKNHKHLKLNGLNIRSERKKITVVIIHKLEDRFGEVTRMHQPTGRWEI